MKRSTKNHIVIAATLIIAGVTATCNRETKVNDREAASPKSDYVSSQEYNRMLAAKNSTEDTLYRTIDEFETRLRTIASTQGILVSEQAEKLSKRDAILRTLDQISALLDENKAKIKKLNSQLSTLRRQRAQWSKDSEGYRNAIAEKEQELAALEQQVGFQATTINYLNQIVNDLKQENNKAGENIKKMDTELHKAYYTLGSYRELKEHQVVEKTGGVLGLGRTESLKPDFEKNYFTEIDTRQVTTIPVKRKKAKLVTHHPVGSYEWQKSESGNAEALTIKDPEKFWATSRYLVVEVK